MLQIEIKKKYYRLFINDQIEALTKIGLKFKFTWKLSLNTNFKKNI
jgi:hypothetical protein